MIKCNRSYCCNTVVLLLFAGDVTSTSGCPIVVTSRALVMSERHPYRKAHISTKDDSSHHCMHRSSLYTLLIFSFIHSFFHLSSVKKLKSQKYVDSLSDCQGWLAVSKCASEKRCTSNAMICDMLLWPCVHFHKIPM